MPHVRRPDGRESRRWKGRRIVGPAGERIGVIVEVYADPPGPTWGLVRLGRLPGRQRAVPLDGALSTDQGVAVSFDRATVLGAPTIEAGSPSPQEAARLITHYALQDAPDAPEPAPVAAHQPPSGELAAALAEARYREERVSLYRAKIQGPRATSPQHMRELERARDGAVANLRRLREQREPS